MDDDCDILSLAIESVENEIDQNTDKDGNGIKDLSSQKFKGIAVGQFFSGSQNSKPRSLVGVDLCFEEKPDINSPKLPEKLSVKKLKDDLLTEKSVVHTGDTDSSDDEDNKYFEETKYDSFGKFIKNKLKNTESHSIKDQQVSWKKSLQNSSGNAVPSNPSTSQKVVPKNMKVDVSADPIFGIRIINPLVSSMVIKEKMIGRTPISFGKLKSHVSHGDLKNDWVIAAVMVRKLPPRVSQNGNNYSSWILSDLKNDLKTVFLFLFGKAHQELWKTASGTVLAILNPSVLSDKTSSEYEAKLSIKSPDQVMIWGRSKDLGQCKVMKKNGEMCGAFVNSYLCEVCVYHVKQEYNKCKSRAEFSASQGNNVNLRNKVLGKNEVFYGGKSFTAVPPKKKTTPKDANRLKGLGATIVEVPEVVSIPNLQRSNEILKLIPSVNNPLNKVRPSDKNRLNQLASKETKKEVKNSSPTSESSNKYDFKTKLPNGQAPTLSIPGSVDKSVLKSIVPGIKLPTLSNPESEVLFDKKCNKKEIKLINSSSEKLSNGNRKKNKTTLQKRFNSLVNIQPEVKEEKKSISTYLGVTSANWEKAVQKKTDKKLAPEKPETTKVSDNLSMTHDNKISESRDSNENKSIAKKSICTNENIKISEHSPKNISKPTSTNLANATENNDLVPNSSSRVAKDYLHSNMTEMQNSPTINAIKNHKSSGTNSPNLTISKAKLKALLYVKAKGPINKENTTKSKTGVKRPFPSEKDENEGDDNKKSVLSERFIQLMNQKSLHEDLIEMREYEQELEYFEKMEKKDRFEEKMLSTYKVDCKAVKCLKCNYLWFSAAEACKAEGHPLKVIDATKRFFKCGRCDNRTVSLTIIPLLPCKKCSSTNWVRTAMIKEKIAKNDSLSIRGGEQKFFNSVITNASLNLLVPDE